MVSIHNLLICAAPVSDFTVSVDPIQGTVQQGHTIQETVTIQQAEKYPYDVSLSAPEQSTDVSVTFNSPIGKPTPTFTSTLTVSASPNASVGTYTITIYAIGAQESKEHSCKYTLHITAGSDVSPSMSVTNLFYASGWMGDWGDIKLDTASTNNPHSTPLCIKITYSAAGSQGNEWAGLYWQYPTNNWGDKTGGRDLTGVTKLTFWARGEIGGEKGEFKVGGISGQFPDSIQPAVTTEPAVVTLSAQWQQYTIDLTGKDLSHVVGGFTWVTNTDQNPNGCTFYLDDLQFV